MLVYFMRHGETNYNKLGLCNDDPAREVYLTATGIQQAEQVAQQLQHDKLELIVTSELPRTIQTAKIINRFHHVPIIQHAAINDIRSGFDGLPVRDYFAAIDADPLHSCANGGESLLQHKARVLTYFEWLKQQSAQQILTVAHEETMRVFYAYFNQLADEQLPDLHFDNCEVLKYQMC
jgi:alpha-ribazole phosphatase